MISHYILDGKQVVRVGLTRWANWMEEFYPQGCRVAEDWVGEVRISTVFLGVDYNFFGEGPPVVFESMIFQGPLNHEMQRYCTWEEAENGHKEMVAKVKRSQPKHLNEDIHDASHFPPEEADGHDQ